MFSKALVALLAFALTSTIYAQSPRPLIVKANLLRGPQHVTAWVDPTRLEEAFTAALSPSAYRILTLADSALATEALRVDLFAYQVAAAYPVIVLTVRQGTEVVHSATETRALFGNRKRLFLKLAAELGEDFPPELPTDLRYAPTLGNVTGSEGGGTIGLSAIITKAVAQSSMRGQGERSDVQSDDLPPFLIPGAFADYLAQTVALLNPRRRLRSGAIELEFSVDALGRSRFVAAQSEPALTAAERDALDATVRSFPLWGREAASGQVYRVVLSAAD